MHEIGAEVLVIGAGPAGLAAAAAAADDGADVLVVDENPRPGGQIWRAERNLGVRSEAGELVTLALSHGARFLSDTTVFDAAGGRTLFAVNGHGPV
ncbi:MAG TPA: FAD-dependent oxidoreductase, partial [Gemmatimonadales bacterium]|nr:FAD-dependent oxidoreductase [Gemmatimonadales bacterium]